MAALMTTQDALNGIYMMLSTIVELQNTKSNNNSNTSETDLTIISLLKGIIETNSAENIQSTGQALESLAKGVAAFDDSVKKTINDMANALGFLNQSLRIITDKKGLYKSVDDLLKLFNELGKVKKENAENFILFIELLVIKDPAKLKDSSEVLSNSLKALNLVVDIDIKTLIKNLKYLGKNKKVAKSISEFIESLHESITSKKTKNASVETAKAISILLEGISEFANTSIWKLFKVFNPISAKLIGNQIISFITGIANAVDKKYKASKEQIEAIGNILKSIAALGTSKDFNIKNISKSLSKKNGKKLGQFFKTFVDTLPTEKNAKEKIISVTLLLETLLKFNAENLKILALLGYVLNPKQGKRIAEYITNLCSAKITEKKVENTLKIIDAFVKLTYSIVICFSVLAVLVAILPFPTLVTATVLLKYIVKFAKNTIILLSEKISQKQIKDVNSIISTMTTMLLTLTGTLTVLIFVSKFAKLKDIGLGVGMLLIVAGTGYYIINHLQPLANNKEGIENTISAVHAISILFLAISASLSILILVNKNATADDIGGAILTVTLFTVLSVCIIAILSKIDSKLLNNASNALLKISAVYAIMSLVAVTLLIPIGEKFIAVLLGSAVIFGTIFGMISIITKLSKLNKTLYNGFINLGIMLLTYTAITVIINTIIIPMAENIIPATLGTLLVLTTIGAFIFGIQILAKVKTKTLLDAVLATAVITVIFLTISLIIKELVIPIGEVAETAVKGLLITGGVLLSMISIVYLIATISNKKLKKSYKNLIDLAIVSVLLSISVGIITLVALKAGEKAGDTFLGLLAVGTIILGTVLIVKYIPKLIKEKDLIKGGIILAGLSGLIGLMGICLNPIISLALKAGENPGDTFAGLGVIATIITGTGVMVLALGALGSNPLIWAALGFGAALMAGITAVTALIAGMVHLIIPMINSVKEYKKEDFVIGGEKIVALMDVLKDVLLSVANPLYIPAAMSASLVLLLMMPAVGSIRALSKTISRIVKEINVDDITKFRSIAIGNGDNDENSLLGSLKSIIDKFTEFGIGSATGAMLIALAIRPVINTVSTFIDVIKKVATLSYVSGYDKNGKPIFDLLNPSVFKDAAIAVSDGFGTFLDTLNEKFTLSLASSLLLVGLIGRTLNPIVDTVSKFVDIVIKVATLLIVTGYDDNGKPIYDLIKTETFSEAASKVSTLFGEFIDTLGAKMNNMSNRSLYVIDSIKKTMKPVMEAVSTFVDTVIKVATLLIVTGYDDNGKPIYDLIKTKVFGDAASKVSYYFGYFLSELDSKMKVLSPQTINAMNSIKKSIAPVMKGISHFVDAIVKLVTALIPDKWDEEGNPIHFKEITPDLYILAALTISVTFGIFLGLITKNFKADSFTSKTESALKAISNTIEPVMEGITKWTDAIYKLATGVIEYDKWDDKSKKYIKITEKIDPKSYRTAATVITESFTSFILTLTKYLTGDIQEQAKNLKDVINDSINPIMDAVLKFSQALEPFLNIQDKDAKSVETKYLAAKTDFVKNIATEIATSFVEFIRIIATEFANETNQENYKSIATITPTINKVLDHISKSSTKLRNIIKSLTDDNNKVLKNGTEVAAQFIASLNAFVKSGDEKSPGLKDANTYYNAYDVYKTYINPLLSESIRSAKFIENVVSLIHNDNISYKSVIDNFNSIIESITSKSISVHTRIKDIDFTQIRSMADTYQHIALKFTLISHYMNVNKDLTTGIDIFISNLDRLTNKEINANIIATGGNIKIYVEQLDLFTSLIKTTVKQVKIYVTELDKAREALEALDKQIIDNEKARNNALLSFADKINNITDAVNNLKDSFNALNENKILSQFNNIRNLLNTINNDIEESNNKEVNVTVNKSVNNHANAQPVLSGKNTVNNVHTPILANNVKVEFIIDNRVIPGFMNIVPK